MAAVAVAAVLITVTIAVMSGSIVGQPDDDRFDRRVDEVVEASLDSGLWDPSEADVLESEMRAYLGTMSSDAEKDNYLDFLADLAENHRQYQVEVEELWP